MIKFVKKTDAQATPEQVADNRFEQIRKAAAEAHKKSDAETPRRRPASES
jgi:hypothetical protein